MNNTLENQKYESIFFSKEEIEGIEFIECNFYNCDFAALTTLSNIFSNCHFYGCNFSNIKFIDAQLAAVCFEGCKLIGVNFSRCSKFLFEVEFRKCLLDYSSFESLKMAKTPFIECSLKGADFAQADLNKSQFIRTDLSDAIFFRTNLKDCNFISAHGYIINPADNMVKGAKFSLEGLPGLLTQYKIKIEPSY